MTRRSFAEVFPRGLIVSCQALPGDSLDTPDHLAAMARAAARGGAVGIRANGAANVGAIRARVPLPVIAISKIDTPGFDVRITPTFAAAHDVARLGPQAIALDATGRPRPGGDDLATLIRRIHEELDLPVVADIATRDEGIRAADLGADAVATTLSGHTAESPAMDGPDLELVAALATALKIPVLGEGRFATPAQVAEALRRGAHAVVVGTAITRPQAITEHFVAGIEQTLASQ